MAVRFAPFPVIAAARGLTLGGGCEFCLAAAARVVAAELRIGLVETAVGLIPGAGGCKEMARRSSGGTIDRAFRTIFSGRFSDNAHQGRQWGLVQGEDRLRMNDRGIVAEALRLGSDLASGYQPPVEKAIETAGDPEADRLQQVLAADRDAEKVTRHEYEVGVRLAGVLLRARAVPGGSPRTGFPRPGARDLSRALRHGGNKGTHAAHAEDRQTIEKLIYPKGRRRVAIDMRNGSGGF